MFAGGLMSAAAMEEEEEAWRGAIITRKVSPTPPPGKCANNSKNKSHFSESENDRPLITQLSADAEEEEEEEKSDAKSESVDEKADAADGCRR